MNGSALPETALIIDDDEQVRGLLGGILEYQQGLSVVYAGSGAEARELVRNGSYCLCLCDIGLPDCSGLDLARELVELGRDIAVLIVTGQDSAALGEQALAFGAYGYVVKPFRANELLVAVRGALRRRELAIAERQRHAELEEMVRERTAELHRSREETVKRLAAAIELRDRGTGDHIERVAELVEALARRAGLPGERCELIGTAACLHDVGKIGIPDELLNKPGPLTPEERKQVERHVEIGHAILDGSHSELLQVAATIALTHHERFDGGGYPRKLVGPAIPIEGRIVALCDVYDALLSDRPYRPALSVAEAHAYIAEQAGGHFDPFLTSAFFAEEEVSV